VVANESNKARSSTCGRADAIDDHGIGVARRRSDVQPGGLGDQSVDVGDTQVTDAGVRALQKVLPHLVIRR